MKAAVVVGNPFDLQIANKILQGSLLGKEVYQRVMGSMRRKFKSCVSNETDMKSQRT